MKFKIKKYIKFLKYFILKKSYLLRNPKLTAYLWVIFSDVLFSSENSKKRSVLVFKNGGGDLDLLSRPKNRVNNERYLCIDKSTTDDLFMSFFGFKSFDYTYESSIKKQQKNYKKYSNFINSVVNSLNKQHHIIGFINFNHVYSSHREIMNVAENKKIPFVVVFKECFRNKNLWQDTIEAYKHLIKKSNPSKTLVHNHDSKLALLTSGIIDEKKITIIGQARSDKLFLKKERLRYSRKKILFFTISPTAGVPVFSLDLLPNRSKDERERKFLIEKRIKHNKKILSSLINYVEKNKEFDLIVKGKQRFWFDYKKMKMNNVFFNSGPPDFNLLLSSNLVIGYNTTGLVEAIAADIPAISVEIKEDIKYRHDYKDVIHQVNDVGFLWKKLDQILNDEIIQDNKNKNYILDKYLGNSDGKAGIRLWNELDGIWNQKFN
tara:strand:+ start:941 stop:2242 length:1302 start_codon:yes stop_codon:yes gene_type:complete